MYDPVMVLPNTALIKYELVSKRVGSSYLRYSLCHFLDDLHVQWGWRIQKRCQDLVMGTRSRNLDPGHLEGGKMMTVVEYLVSFLV